MKCASYITCETYFVLLVSLSLIYLTSYFSSPPILCSQTSLGALEQTLGPVTWKDMTGVSMESALEKYFGAH